MTYQISFENSKYDPVEFPEGSLLSEVLNIQNSPILFGCRTGICGTCLIRVYREFPHSLHEKTDEEKEYFDVFPPPPGVQLRLACQVRLTSNIHIAREGL